MIPQNTTQNIKVPTPEMDILKKHFSHCFDKHGNFQFDKFKQSLSEKEVNFSKESYTMDWLGKSYARLLASDPATTLLKEDVDHNQNPENQKAENLLLKGDNLEVLKHLTGAYYEKIKMIYIDPPYNTGGDGFVYQDDRKFTVEELQELAGIDEERAKRILDFTQSNSNSHSAWLTFMYPRLYIAKQLMREDGVIFISIDDNEVAQLKLLMDEIFGEENFVTNVIWQNSIQPKGYTDKFSIHHNYTLVYQKSPAFQLKLFARTKEDNKAYSNPDNDSRGKWRSGDVRNALYRPNLIYDLISPSGKKIKSPEKGWRWSKSTMKNKIESGEIIFNHDETWIKRKIFLKDQNGRPPESIWFAEKFGSTRSASNNIKSLFGKNIFETPKPVELIQGMLEISADMNSIILDFFAGSGTTGDAIMQLNAEDSGNRKYILVQLPEKLDKKKDKTAYDFVNKELKVNDPTIFEITKERLLRAAKKINTELDNKNEELQKEIKKLKGELPTEETQQKIEELEEEIQQNKEVQSQNVFKVFETQPIWEDYEFEAEELTAQTKLFDESKLSKDDVQTLLTTWKTNDGLELTEDLTAIDLKGYIGYYGQNKLYLMDKGFSTENLKEILLKIDQDKAFNPTSIIAFGYHFESKNLREIAENVKSYANKKNVDVDFVVRY